MQTAELNLDIRQKIKDAMRVVDACIGTKGVWASPYRYRDQCWTRDFVIAAEELLLKIGHRQIVETHLTQLGKRQYDDGRMPIMYLDDEKRWIRGKVENSIREQRFSFLLNAYLSNEGVGQLSPWTRDSELLFVLGYAMLMANAAAVSEVIPDHRVEKALAYVETYLMKNGLVHGADWRDTRKDLDDKFLLSNNCLLYRAYALLNMREKADTLKARINDRYWTGTHYRDHTATDAYDTLGNALAILNGIAPQDRWRSMLVEAEKLNTPCGFMLNSVTLPPKNTVEKEVMDRVNQFGVVWPFIHGFMIMAMAESGLQTRAHEEFGKWTAMPGFFEWYDPQTGSGHGSVDQLWSAALYLRVASMLGHEIQ